MKHPKQSLLTLTSALFLLTAAANPIEMTKQTAENQIRNLITPLLAKFCPEECKVLAINPTVEVAVDDSVAPGFDDIETRSPDRLAPSNATVKLLMDEKVGPVSRAKLLELVQQYLDTLEYPVKVDVQVTRFPQPTGSAGRIAELRDQVSKKFRKTIDDLFAQFCPNQCLLADYDLRTEIVNEEEALYGSPGEFYQDNGAAIRVKSISGTILIDDLLPPEVSNTVLEMARLRTNEFRNVSLSGKSMRFPKPLLNSEGYVIGDGRSLASIRGKNEKIENTNQSRTSQENQLNTQSTNNSQEKNSISSNTQENSQRQERFERFEKIERVENGDAVQQELRKFGWIGLIFLCSIVSLLVLIMATAFRASRAGQNGEFTIRQFTNHQSSAGSAGLGSLGGHGATDASGANDDGTQGTDSRTTRISKRYEIERLMEELTSVFGEQPKVAKQVFSRILTEEGVETTAHYIHLFGEGIVVDLLRDPSIQADVSELMEFYAKNPVELTDDEKLDLLKQLHNRTIAAKLWVLGSRSSNLFDFLSEMDATQVSELVRTESLTVKAIVLTQCDPQKRTKIYASIDDQTRMKLLTELSRIDYLPRDYIFNVAAALKRKRRENPQLNTEALPGSEVLITLLERTTPEMQTEVFKSLEGTNPESARIVKSKLVSVDTLRFLREGQLLEVILSLKHDELLQFLKGVSGSIQGAIIAKAPKELVVELQDELEAISVPNRETYQVLERKVINRIKSMASDGQINLIEVNERMFAEANMEAAFMEATQNSMPDYPSNVSPIKKVAGW